MFIDEQHYQFCCTPDGMIGNDGILIIKSPYSAINTKAEQAAKSDAQVKKIQHTKDTSKLN